MTGREVIEIHNDSHDLVGFEIVRVDGAYDEFAIEMAAIQEEVAAAPEALGKQSADVALPRAAAAEYEAVVLRPGRGSALELNLDDATYAVVCTRYGPIQATVRQIGAIGPLRVGE